MDNVYKKIFLKGSFNKTYLKKFFMENINKI